MLPLGVMLLASGLALLAVARPLHEGWRDMNRRVRRAGHRDMVFGSEWLASDRGLAVMKRAGAAATVVGGVLLAVWAVRAALG